MRPFHKPEPWQKRFYNSARWRKCRQAVIQRQHGLCADCLALGTISRIEEVHHETELTPENVSDPDVSLNPDRCVGLCHDCHDIRHGRQVRRTVPRVGFDADGNPVPKEVR